jgi:hypothetical protein
LGSWIGALPEAEKDALLLRLAEGDATHLRGEFLLRFREARAKAKGKSSKAGDSGAPSRTVGQLLAAGEARAEEERRREAEEEAEKHARRAKEEAQAREKRLDALEGREAGAWRQVETLIETKQKKEYDRAVELVKDLHALGERAGCKDEVTQRIRELRKRHAHKSSFLRRLDGAGLKP